jgi:hypothetical protein
MRKLLLVSFVFLAVSCHRQAAKTTVPAGGDNVIHATEVERIERTLSADDMLGRRAGTPGIEKAAAFIESEFAATGLEKFPGLTTYRQEFSMVQARHLSTTAIINGKEADKNEVIVLSQQESVDITDKSGFEKVYIKPGQQFITEVRKHTGLNKNLIVMVDTSHRKNFSRLTGLRRPTLPSAASQVFILGDENVNTFSITTRQTISKSVYTNIIGILPGKSRKDEYVIFSGHYDHLGIGKPSPEGDSIYNGANDDAAGTTAVIMLAKYFKQLNNNERTLVFVAFTAEESGGFGSNYFSQQLNADKVVAMFNIEMIGTESKWGKNSAYITGYDKSDMGAMLQKNLEGSSFTFYPDPYPEQNLFLRSDNATLARLGVPAHTISTSKMDVEKYYHRPDDEIETLDLQNMTAIIRAIALSSTGIVNGQQTPTRVAR